MLINSKQFNFQFFLSSNKKVASLEEGAIKYGGATKYNDGIYSNIEGSEYIHINDKNNKISIFVPDTINVNQKTDNSDIINYSIKYLQHCFNTNNLIYYKTKGSWYSKDLKKVVYDNITIITLETDKLTEKDIEIFIQLATLIKQEMHQEGVSIAINTALAIV